MMIGRCFVFVHTKHDLRVKGGERTGWMDGWTDGFRVFATRTFCSRALSKVPVYCLVSSKQQAVFVVKHK